MVYFFLFDEIKQRILLRRKRKRLIKKRIKRNRKKLKDLKEKTIVKIKNKVEKKVSFVKDYFIKGYKKKIRNRSKRSKK